jgi:putative hemolysin
MSNVTVELVFLLLLSVANGVFAMSEAAMISARKTRLQQRAEAGDAGARAALKLAESPNRFLSTVQIGITLIGILSGAFGGSTLAQNLAPIFEQIPVLAPYSEALSVVVIVLFITYLSLVIGELVPKRLALNNPEGIAAAVARPMSFLSKITSPIVSFLGISSDLVLRLLGVKLSDEPPITEEEVKIILEQGEEAGVFEEAEREIMTNVFRLGDWRVHSVMTPRTDIVWLDLDDSPEANRKKITESRHIAYPVFKKDRQHLMGIVSVKDLWAQDIQTMNLQAALTQPLFIPANTPSLKALELFRQSGTHMGIVIDEHGDPEGIVTLTDLIEAIIGDIASEHSESQAVQREDGSWLLDGLMNIHEAEEILEMDIFPDNERSNYQTVGGFVMMRVGRIPLTGDHFEWNELRFEVMDMDGRRVDKVMVKLTEPEKTEPEKKEE